VERTTNYRACTPTALLALLLGSCLPDPRPYDPCKDDFTYYSVPPTGCNGHQLTVLASVPLPHFDGSLGFSGRTPNRIITDTDYVYWEGPFGVLLQTPKNGGETVRLREASANAGYLELQSVDSKLYVLAVDNPGTSNESQVRLDGIDKATRQRTTIASYTVAYNGVLTYGFQISGDKFYTNTSQSPLQCLMEGSLSPTDPQSSNYRCATSYQPYRFSVTERGIAYAAYESGSTSLYFESTLNLAPQPLCETESNVSVFSVEGDYVYWVACPFTGDERAAGCSRYRSDLAGTKEVLIADVGHPDAAIGDAHQLYAQTSFTQEWPPSQLYAWEALGMSPVVVAAGIPYTVAMTMDDKSIFTVTAAEGADGQPVIELLRIER